MFRAKLLIILLLFFCLVCSCQAADSSQSLDYVPIEPEFSDIDQSNQEGLADHKYIYQPHNMNKLFDEDLVILDNSDGLASIYEIDVLLPYSISQKWAEDHPTVESDLCRTVTEHWKMNYDLLYAIQWFWGRSFTWNTITEENDRQKFDNLIQYSPPPNTIMETVKTAHIIPISDLPYWEELPISFTDGEISSTNNVICYDLRNEYFPQETSIFPDNVNTLHFVALSQYYVDNIPVNGTMETLGIPRGVFQKKDLVGPTIGSRLLSVISIPHIINDYFFCMTKTADFKILSTVEKDKRIKPVYDCEEGIVKGSEYLGYEVDNIHIFAAELAYMPLSDFNISAGDFYENAHTYLIPVWNFYFRSEDVSGFCCISVDAITGDSLYSDEYLFQDERIFGSGV